MAAHLRRAATAQGQQGSLSVTIVVCRRTLYTYTDQSLLGIHNYSLPEKLKSAGPPVCQNREELATSLKSAPKDTMRTSEVRRKGSDLVLSHKTKGDKAHLTLSECLSRECLIHPCPGYNSCPSTMQAFQKATGPLQQA